MSKKPIIAVVCCQKNIDGQSAQAVYQKYIDAVNHHGGNPILLPYTAATDDNLLELMRFVDGIMLTGSYSNVAPARYDATHLESKQDLLRDALSFNLLEYAKTNGTPLLAICRGLQEMNVYFGGTLYPDWRLVEGFFEPHLEDPDQPLHVQYQPVHDVIMQHSGKLELFSDVWRVNSLHKQAINRLGEGLFVEAIARDGLIEAISYPNHPFMLGVQWHPEVSYEEDALSRFIFSTFIRHAANTVIK